jgi:hypothetical protein
MLDILNNQFYLYTYLEYVENCSSIQDFVENNGYNLNYICIGKIHVDDGSTLLVASNTKEYRMIFIKYSMNSENNIHLVGSDQYIIVYDDLIINIGGPITIYEINKLLAVYGEEVIIKPYLCESNKIIHTSSLYNPNSSNVQNIKIITTKSNLINPYTIIFQTASTIYLESIDDLQIGKIILPPNIKKVSTEMSNYSVYKYFELLPLNLYSLTTRLQRLRDNRLLPKNLHTLHIIGSDHVNLEFLPITLRKLVLDVAKTQQLLPNILPKNLHKLVFGDYFNNDIELNVIPESVRIINFNRDFNKAIKPFSLPEDLHTLIFGKSFNQHFKQSSLSKNLHTLIFGYGYNTRIDRNVLPKKLNTLIFGDSYNKQLGYDNTLQGYISYLPDSLQVLEFGNAYNQQIFALPPNLITLKFGNSYDTPMFINILPKTLENLTFGLKYNCSLILVMNKNTKVYGLPPALKTLILGPYFKQPFYHKMIPDTMEKITLPKIYISMQLEDLFNVTYV